MPRVRIVLRMYCIYYASVVHVDITLQAFLLRVYVVQVHVQRLIHMHYVIHCYIFSGGVTLYAQIYTGKGFKKNGNPFLYTPRRASQSLWHKTDLKCVVSRLRYLSEKSKPVTLRLTQMSCPYHGLLYYGDVCTYVQMYARNCLVTRYRPALFE